MIINFHHIPGDRIRIRDGQGNEYVDTLDNFRLDAPDALYPDLPEGIREFQYYDGVRSSFITEGFAQGPADSVFTEAAEFCVNNLTSILVAQSSRQGD